MSYSPYFFNRSATGSVKAVGSNFQNASGSTLSKGTPAAINATSQLIAVNPSIETTVLAMVGMANVDIPNGATGGIQDGGRLENITTSFALGDPVWVSKTGGLTNLKPEIGVDGFLEGDFVIFLGVIVKNEFNVSLKDIKLMISIVGQL